MPCSDFVQNVSAWLSKMNQHPVIAPLGIGCLNLLLLVCTHKPFDVAAEGLVLLQQHAGLLYSVGWLRSLPCSTVLKFCSIGWTMDDRLRTQHTSPTVQGVDWASQIGTCERTGVPSSAKSSTSANPRSLIGNISSHNVQPNKLTGRSVSSLTKARLTNQSIKPSSHSCLQEFRLGNSWTFRMLYWIAANRAKATSARPDRPQLHAGQKLQHIWRMSLNSKFCSCLLKLKLVSLCWRLGVRIWAEKIGLCRCNGDCNLFGFEFAALWIWVLKSGANVSSRAVQPIE
ncbi:hypothetical protein Nepgr_027258 [Nepenthes gracilis]|uniref:Uncharacterized protein n=1 Tax=Nepenthes gracilis TaxID=150966 RepID=A0AAD3T8A5_NEPGR|nr:hypothetical protein Nepgr_027258 [Nepenthes gracilis]